MMLKSGHHRSRHRGEIADRSGSNSDEDESVSSHSRCTDNNSSKLTSLSSSIISQTPRVPLLTEKQQRLLLRYLCVSNDEASRILMKAAARHNRPVAATKASVSNAAAFPDAQSAAAPTSESSSPFASSHGNNSSSSGSTATGSPTYAVRGDFCSQKPSAVNATVAQLVNPEPQQLRQGHVFSSYGAQQKGGEVRAALTSPLRRPTLRRRTNVRFKSPLAESNSFSATSSSAADAESAGTVVEETQESAQHAQGSPSAMPSRVHLAAAGGAAVSSERIPSAVDEQKATERIIAVPNCSRCCRCFWPEQDCVATTVGTGSRPATTAAAGAATFCSPVVSRCRGCCPAVTQHSHVGSRCCHWHVVPAVSTAAAAANMCSERCCCCCFAPSTAACVNQQQLLPHMHVASARLRSLDSCSAAAAPVSSRIQRDAACIAYPAEHCLCRRAAAAAAPGPPVDAGECRCVKTSISATASPGQLFCRAEDEPRPCCGPGPSPLKQQQQQSEQRCQVQLQKFQQQQGLEGDVQPLQESSSARRQLSSTNPVQKTAVSSRGPHTCSQQASANEPLQQQSTQVGECQASRTALPAAVVEASKSTTPLLLSTPSTTAAVSPAPPELETGWKDVAAAAGPTTGSVGAADFTEAPSAAEPDSCTARIRLLREQLSRQQQRQQQSCLLQHSSSASSYELPVSIRAPQQQQQQPSEQQQQRQIPLSRGSAKLTSSRRCVYFRPNTASLGSVSGTVATLAGTASGAGENEETGSLTTTAAKKSQQHLLRHREAGLQLSVKSVAVPPPPAVAAPSPPPQQFFNDNGQGTATTATAVAPSNRIAEPAVDRGSEQRQQQHEDLQQLLERQQQELAEQLRLLDLLEKQQQQWRLQQWRSSPRRSCVAGEELHLQQQPPQFRQHMQQQPQLQREQSSWHPLKKQSQAGQQLVAEENSGNLDFLCAADSSTAACGRECGGRFLGARGGVVHVDIQLRPADASAPLHGACCSRSAQQQLKQQQQFFPGVPNIRWTSPASVRGRIGADSMLRTSQSAMPQTTAAAASTFDVEQQLLEVQEVSQALEAADLGSSSNSRSKWQSWPG